MAWADAVKADAEAVANPAELGEEITYTPHNGSPTTVRAVVRRNPEEIAGNVKRDAVEITVPNSATYGVTSITRGQDTVTLEPILGAGNETLRVVEILAHGQGWWHLRCHR